ncbi:hypothetical protein K435DRAFT_521449 [Dendrothele bispora CBS 962.96]|uniref:Uncharacterized protein n=1 Tax=Dendrothele bispora (strain CBS 962.96) TaxID=1314807 RepID=A0A4V4HGG8_DENBC|nr:hypothetical protein K435DRAFT_521449 [Dendrothele bispora CBS 962.96]
MVNFLQSPDNAEQDGISHRPPENTQLPDEIRVTLCTPPIEHSLPNSEPHSTPRHSDCTFVTASSNDPSRNTLTPPGPSGSMRPTRQGLPQLAIPNPRSLSSDLPASHSATSQSESPPSSDRLFGHAHSESQSTTPETPASLSSPIVGVVDLTKNVRTTSTGPDFHGGYSDIYCGEWEKELEVDSNLDDARSDTSAPTMVEDTSISTTGAVRRTKIVKVAIKLLRVLSASGYDEVRARKVLNYLTRSTCSPFSHVVDTDSV